MLILGSDSGLDFYRWFLIILISNTCTIHLGQLTALKDETDAHERVLSQGIVKEEVSRVLPRWVEDSMKVRSIWGQGPGQHPRKLSSDAFLTILAQSVSGSRHAFVSTSTRDSHEYWESKSIN
jgi:hypothetical protein